MCHEPLSRVRGHRCLMLSWRGILDSRGPPVASWERAESRCRIQADRLDVLCVARRGIRDWFRSTLDRTWKMDEIVAKRWSELQAFGLTNALFRLAGIYESHCLRCDHLTPPGTFYKSRSTKPDSPKRSEWHRSREISSNNEMV